MRGYDCNNIVWLQKRRSAQSMDATEYMSLVTSASSLLGDNTLLPGNQLQPTELSCDEYVTYVDELLRSITPQVITVDQTVFRSVGWANSITSQKLSVCVSVY